MTVNRQRYAWIWVAVAAIAVATIARAQSDLPQSSALRSALTHPVLQFLSAHSSHEGSAVAVWNRRPSTAHAHRASQQGSSSWMVLLPIFFIGLIAPLSLISPRGLLSLGHFASNQFRPFLFQRPPPSFCF